MDRAFDADNDALGIDRIDDTSTPAENHRARIARCYVFHTGADIGRIAAKQRNRLPLHVRTHERAVGVIVLKERNQAGSNRDQLLRTDVHVLDFFAAL